MALDPNINPGQCRNCSAAESLVSRHTGRPGSRPALLPSPLMRGRGGKKSHAPTGLREDLLDHVPLHVGQPHVAAGVAVGQLLVVEAEQVQDGRVPVVDVDLALDGLVAVVVGPAVGQARPSRRRRPSRGV